MKIQQLSFPFLLSLCCLISTYNAKSQDNQQQAYTIYTNKELESLYAPIIFSTSGIKNFFINTFNRTEYAQEVLPNDFSHFIQLIDRSSQQSNSSLASQTEIKESLRKARAKAKGVVRIFKNKMHSCSYINAYAFDSMLHDITDSLALMMHAEIYKSEQDLARNAYDLLYSTFSNNFSMFRHAPQPFLMDLSRSLVNQLNDYYLPNACVEELRAILIRFLEIGLSKLVWHPHDGFKTWESAKSVADHLAEFVEHGIIEDVEDLNDLYISLLERYIFFLDVSGNELPVSFYTRAKEDIATNSIILLKLEEQEEFLEPKSLRFLNILNLGEAKAIARELVAKTNS